VLVRIDSLLFSLYVRNQRRVTLRPTSGFIEGAISLDIGSKKEVVADLLRGGGFNQTCTMVASRFFQSIRNMKSNAESRRRGSEMIGGRGVIPRFAEASVS
jgi:hypothetical protein